MFSDPTPAHGLLDHVKDRKASIKWKWNERDYNSQERKYVPPTSVKISCDTTQLLILSFCVPHAKLYGVRELSKHYCLLVEPKLFHGKFAIRRIPFACIACTTMLEKLR